MRSAADGFAPGTWGDRRGWVLAVLARREDLIVSGGENVYPAEIEGVLRAHPDVIDAVVIGIPIRNGGGPPRLVVQRSSRTTELLSFLRERLAGFKIPRVIPVEAIPLLQNGKPDRFSIRSRYVSPTPPPPP